MTRHSREVHDALSYLKASSKPEQFNAVRLIEDALFQPVTGFGQSNADAAEFLESRGAFAIAEERLRQKKVEGYHASHDDEHDKGELAKAAAWYAIPADTFVTPHASLWPQDWAVPADHFISSTMTEHQKIALRKRELEKAGALLAAEWDRLDRVERRL